MIKYSILLFFIVLSCQEADNAINQAFNTTNGAVLRTLEIENLTLDKSNPDMPISLLLEFNDGQGGDLLSSVDITLSYVDRTEGDGNGSIEPTFYNSLDASDFQLGENGLPITNLIFSTDALLDFFGLTENDVTCTDQFIVDLTLNLTDGRSFNHDNSIGPIISFSGAIRSPFTYDIYVVEGVSNDYLTGIYSYNSIDDGFEGSTFIMPEIVEITPSRPNARSFEVIRDEQLNVQGGVLFRAEIDFTIACDQIILSRYVRSAIVCASGVEGDQHVLLGPSQDLQNTVSLNDDTVFDLRIIEAFEGNDGLCGWPETQSITRFSKQ